MTLEQGSLVNGRYRILDILGQGGMGSVYRAMDENLGVEVAVKENLFTTDEYSRQFRLEAVILASLRHPNLTRVTDHFVMSDLGQYLVMDYIEGEDLRQRMERQGTIPEEDAIIIGAAICDALTYLHTRKPPVLHRDIKPGNVKITPDGRVFLVDFGLAKLVQGSQTTTTGARAMTPGYSPPEQYGTARTDPRSDVYSLGATLYAALTGVIPEDGLARVMDNMQLTPIRKNNPSVSRRLATAIEKAMEAYPDDRFQNADEFRRGLLNSSSKTQRYTELDINFSVAPPPATPDEKTASPDVRSRPIQAVMDVVTSLTTRLRRRTRRVASGGIWLGAVLIALSAWFLIANPAVMPSALVSLLPPDVAQTYMPSAVGTATAAPLEIIPELVQVTVTVTPEPTLMPTPSPTATPIGGGTGQIAFASTRTGVPQVYIINSDGTGLRPITNEQDGACQPDWSPDGMRLVYVSPCKGRQDSYEGSSLYIINFDGTGRKALSTTLGGDFEPDWSPDGHRIAFTSLRDGIMQIYILDLDNNKITRLLDTAVFGTAAYARHPTWNPFGTQIVYTLRRAGTTQIWVTTDSPVTVANKPNEQLIISGDQTNDYLPVWSPDGDFVVFNQTNLDGTAPPYLMRIRYEDRLTRQAVRVEIAPPISDVSFSPDGFWMAFESKADEITNHDIYLATITGAGRVQLTTDPGVDFDPIWRPVPTPAP